MRVLVIGRNKRLVNAAVGDLMKTLHWIRICSKNVSVSRVSVRLSRMSGREDPVVLLLLPEKGCVRSVTNLVAQTMTWFADNPGTFDAYAAYAGDLKFNGQEDRFGGKNTEANAPYAIPNCNLDEKECCSKQMPWDEAKSTARLLVSACVPLKSCKATALSRLSVTTTTLGSGH